MKKLLVALLGLTLACSALLGGCKNRAEDPNTLTIGLHLGGYGRAWLDEIARRFEDDNPGITVDVMAEPNLTDTYSYKLETQTDLRDIFFGLEVVNVKGWAARGWVEPLDDLYATDIGGVTLEKKIVEGFSRFSEVTSRYGTHQYAVPWNDGASGLFYNVGFFTSQDVRIPTVVDNPACLVDGKNDYGSKSWVEGQPVGLKQVCEYINALRINRDSSTENDVAPFVWSGRIVNYWDFITKTWWVQQIGVEAFREFYEMESAEIINPEKSPMKELKKAVAALDELVFRTPENSMKDCAGKDYTTAQMGFVNGNAAMMCNGPWLESEAGAVNIPGFEMRLMPTPFIDGARTDENGYIPVNNTLAADYAFIPSAAQNKELAKKFLAYMCRDDMLQLYTSLAGTVRPFRFQPDTYGLTNSQQSVIDIWKNSQNFYVVSPTNFSVLQHATPFVFEMPYSTLSTGSGYDVNGFFEQNYQFALNNWQKWQEEL